jgi:hypothetical protein
MKAWTARAETEALWRERVRAWRASGETVKQFAEHEQFAPATLRYWSSRLNRPEEPGFVRVVRRTTNPPAASDVIVEVANARVRVTRGFDATLLAEVVRALGGGAR